jgi:CheY-like chemotaxis protein
LESTQLDIETAENGIVALEMFESDPERYQMIFMDVQMPEMDGLEATRRIRALDTKWAKNIPIIAMTANVFREDVEKCLKAGMNDHVGKPIYLEEVIAKLKQYLPA